MDFLDLANWNPWWPSGKVPEALLGVKRAFDPLLLKALDAREVVALTGVRRCGKSTLLYQLIARLLQERVDASQIFYVNFDDPAFEKVSLDEVYNAYRRHKNAGKKAFLFFDEIQNVPGWEKFVRKLYDLREDCKFVVSGSNAGLLAGEYAGLLTGRNLSFKEYPLSFSEFLAFSGTGAKIESGADKNRVLFALNKFLEEGGFPEAFFKDDALKRLLLKQYFEDIIYKDVVKRHNADPKKASDLAVFLLSNVSNPVTAAGIRRATGLSFDTIREYAGHLQEAFLVRQVEFFSYSASEREQAPKKYYASDTGLRNAVGFRFSKDSGRLAENLVAIELERRGKEFYYWKGRAEVDFVVKNRDNSLEAINACYSDEPNAREEKALEEFREKFKKTAKTTILTKDLEKKSGKTDFVPLWKWLLQK